MSLDERPHTQKEIGKEHMSSQLSASCDEPDLVLLRNLEVQHENRTQDKKPEKPPRAQKAAATAHKVQFPDFMDVIGLAAIRDALVAVVSSAQVKSARTRRHDLRVDDLRKDHYEWYVIPVVEDKIWKPVPTSLSFAFVVVSGFVTSFVRMLVLIGCTAVPDGMGGDDMYDETLNDEDAELLNALEKPPRSERAFTFTEDDKPLNDEHATALARMFDLQTVG